MFYDDTPLLEPKLTSKLCSLAVEGILGALGWAYSRDPAKYKPFSEPFSLLGMELNVSCLAHGAISHWSSQQSRVEEARSLKLELANVAHGPELTRRTS